MVNLLPGLGGQEAETNASFGLASPSSAEKYGKCVCMVNIYECLFFNYPPSSGKASCVGTLGTVMCHLHLTRPCCVALGVFLW